MRWFIRMFFKTLRLVLGPFLLLGEWLSRPKGMQRTEQQQQLVDAQSAHLALYQFRTCPFCIKTRQALRRLSLNIELRDAQHDPQHRQALSAGGGEVKVPCLRIGNEDGSSTWMYESDAIIAYLEQRFG